MTKYFSDYTFFAFFYDSFEILKILRRKGDFEKEPKGGVCHNFLKITDNIYKKAVILTKTPKTTKFERLVGADQTKFLPTKRSQKRPNFPETTKSGHTEANQKVVFVVPCRKQIKLGRLENNFYTKKLSKNHSCLKNTKNDEFVKI